MPVCHNGRKIRQALPEGYCQSSTGRNASLSTHFSVGPINFSCGGPIARCCPRQEVTGQIRRKQFLIGKMCRHGRSQWLAIPFRAGRRQYFPIFSRDRYHGIDAVKTRGMSCLKHKIRSETGGFRGQIAAELYLKLFQAVGHFLKIAAFPQHMIKTQRSDIVAPRIRLLGCPAVQTSTRS